MTEFDVTRILSKGAILGFMSLGILATPVPSSWNLVSPLTSGLAAAEGSGCSSNGQGRNCGGGELFMEDIGEYIHVHKPRSHYFEDIDETIKIHGGHHDFEDIGGGHGGGGHGGGGHGGESDSPT